ncbi:uncharacterized protein BX663DRAFT_489692 [Cokeromyces recurvatus]|uniref:uncharacterized protein n=1 Tax=Cokeromyces recurvatus TaxID=90255 RepID=UPI0022205B74|nr:uncharacterized protein BX663DRAFT_489692 [Cokeromyces recurvatus]KAI7898924.1 hypothetical protein BX663DRAFT_489692 [Cokeromyces recurvatus]
MCPYIASWLVLMIPKHTLIPHNSWDWRAIKLLCLSDHLVLIEADGIYAAVLLFGIFLTIMVSLFIFSLKVYEKLGWVNEKKFDRFKVGLGHQYESGTLIQKWDILRHA